VVVLPLMDDRAVTQPAASSDRGGALAVGFSRQEGFDRDAIAAVKAYDI